MAAVGAGVLLSGSAFAAVETWYWDFAAAGDCSSPAKAKNWSDVNCWTNAAGAHPSVAPSTKDHNARFNVKAANAGVVYVKLDRDIELRQCSTDVGQDDSSMTAANRVIIFGDQQIFLSAGIGGSSTSIEYFCGFKMVDGYFNTTFLCGPVDSASALILNSSRMDYRMDRFATAAGEVRANALKSAAPSYGHYRVYAPAGSATDVTGLWQLTAGSPFAKRLSAAAHVLSAGTTVTASDGSLPAGTFVKRIFDDATIELSENANANATADGSTLTFAAFSTKMRQTLTTFRRQNIEAVYNGPQLLMTSPDDDARLTIVNLGGSDADAAKYFGFDTPSGYYPGTIAISNAYWKGYAIRLFDCHLEFANPTVAGKKAGFPSAKSVLVMSGKTATVTVPDDVAAEFSYLAEVNGTLVKDGAGTLTVASTNKSSVAYPGTVLVKEGTLAFADGSVVPALTVKSGATLRVAGEVSGSSATLESGSTLAGGTLIVDSAADIPTGVTYVDGASVRIRGGSGEVLTELPTAAAAPNAAFWVDFSDAKCFESNGSAQVTLIKDKRGSASAGYMTAAAVGPTYYPRYEALKSVGGSVGSLCIDYRGTTSTALKDCGDPVWSKALTNIRAVYMVQYVSESTLSGGQFLGWTGSDAGDFMRPAQQGFNASLFYSSTTPDKVKKAPLYHNGIRMPYWVGYPYQRNLSGPSGSQFYTPIVTEIHLLDNCKADSFAHNSNGSYRNGGQCICECLVYTNELTETERVATRTYLMRKWLGCEPYWTRGASKNALGTLSGATALSAASGETLYADGLSSGSLVKYGAGDMYLNDVVAPGGSLTVAGGTVTVRSDALTAGSLPSGAYVHLDASDLTTMTTNTVGGTTRVTSWKDCRSDVSLTAGLVSTATNPPALLLSALNGKSVVDFGPYVLRTKDQVKNDMAFAFSKASKRGRTIIGLYGTQNGGGQVWGCAPNAGIGYNDGYGVLRGGNYGGSAGDPLVSYNPACYARYSNVIVSNSVVARVNGTQVDAFRQGFTGGWDVFSLHSWPNRGMDGIGTAHYAQFAGGQSVAEMMMYTNGLSNVQVERIEAYLAKKWKGTVTAGYREAVLDAVNVAAGATLAVEGDGALTVNKISGSGTVAGAVALTANAVLEVVIAEDGSVGTLSIGNVDLSKGGTVRLVGNVRALQKGKQNLIVSSSISAGTAGNWTLAYDGDPRASLSLRAVNGALQLNKTPFGLMLIVR